MNYECILHVKLDYCLVTQHDLSLALQARLAPRFKGGLCVDRFTRGRYATDASHYQIMPAAVAEPRDVEDVTLALEAIRELGAPLTARGGGTSQCGQTINRGLILDFSRHMNRILELDVANRRCVVEPGIVLDELNRQLKPHGLWYPVDVSTASRATIGGMAGNNSCGTRSLRYGTMRDNVISLDALLADGRAMHFGEVTRETNDALFADLLALGARDAREVSERFPKVQRRVGGYNLDALTPNGPANNMAHILVGSEGTLGLSTAIELKLWPLPPKGKLLGVVHFARFYDAMDAAQHIVPLGPVSVELVDRTMIELARSIPLFRPTIERFVRGVPDALLLVEFAEEDEAENLRRLARLSEVVGDLGFGWDRTGHRQGGVVEIADPALQTAIGEVRASGLNIMMSMKTEGRPVSFVEDCAVPLEHLAEYTGKLTQVFEKHGTRATWYAHASVGCLHVRPVLNLKLEKDVRAMRAIAEEAFELVRAYKGSHSGEHGDGMVRSEFHEKMFGPQIVRAFEEVKDRFDPLGVLNPGKIVRPPRMDDRSLFRFPPDYAAEDRKTVLDWSAWPGAAGGFQGAAEMCNNNGACRKLAGGVMCPSFRATRQERDSTRGRANTLRLAISGQLGREAFTSDGVHETLKLCVSCKGCKRECPTGVDMARMKIEVMAARTSKYGLTLRDRLVAYLPRYAPKARRAAGMMNLRNVLPGAGIAGERVTGFSRHRKLPRWRRDAFLPDMAEIGPQDGRPVVLFADTFNTWFEPENLRAAVKVLTAAGYRVILPLALHARGQRPPCCGRTFLSVGLVEEARFEMERSVAMLAPHARAGVPVIGLEPSCALTFRDELTGLLDSEDARAVSSAVLLFEEFLAREHKAGRLCLPLGSVGDKAYLHGHCHQKAFNALSPVEATLGMIPGLSVETIQSGCCGMAGAFGYQAETYAVSMKMGELALLPAVRKAPADALIVADGTSCRHQIADGTGRNALHVARVLESALLNPSAAA